MIWTGDDFRAQSGMIISPRTWRVFFKPRMAEFISKLKIINRDVKVAYHSDGNIEPIILEFIEIGLGNRVLDHEIAVICEEMDLLLGRFWICH